MVRIAGLEPAQVSPLPPQSSASANSAICAQKLPIMKQPVSRCARANSASEHAQHAFEAAPSARGFGLEEGFASRFEINLEEQAHAMCTAPPAANCIDPITIIQHHAPGARGIKHPGADTEVPL